MKRTIFLLAVASLLAGTAVYSARSKGDAQDPHPTPQQQLATPQQQPPAAPQKQPKVDLVIALDTSGSMSGLIDAARRKLWDIVNEVAQARPTPRLRVGLLTYGSSGSEDDGYVILQSDLSTDLDTINAKLFELTTSGGEEYVARVVSRAAAELSWDLDPDTLRQIYVAGNEPADQDRRVSVPQALARAAQKGIFVNAIYCGEPQSSESAGWARVAQLGHGMYAAIDHNHGTVALATPYDQQLSALSAKLNSTYIAYGAEGEASAARQVAQDRLARRAHSSTGAARAKAKASAVYNNSRWDLVDAKKAGKLAAIPKQALPAELQGLSDDELKTRIAAKEQERAAIRAEIKALSAKRDSYAKEEMKKQGISAEKSFDTAVKRALRQQAAKKSIRFN